jgi:hypothetical protein
MAEEGTRRSHAIDDEKNRAVAASRKTGRSEEGC